MRWCAECGQELRGLQPSGWARCCNGWAYWSLLAPTPEDARAFYQLHGRKPPQRGDFFLYKATKCPEGFEPVEPVR